MKTTLAILALCALQSCSPAPEGETAVVEQEAVETDGTGSFRMGNAEIRAEMIEFLDAAEIEHSIGEDGSIIYNLADGEAIDRIGNDVILTYIRRN